MKKLIDYSRKKCCLTCDGFCWWDGDYCCTKEIKIHQFGYGNENGGHTAYPFMNRDIDKTMETPETCEDYEYCHHEKYPESENDYIRQYKKFKEWDRLCWQLEEHVNDHGCTEYKRWYKLC